MTLKYRNPDDAYQNDATFRTAMLADPTGQIERECADKHFKQRDVALTYALAIRDEAYVPVDWTRANAAITARWSKAGLLRVKTMAWARFEEPRKGAASK